MPANAPAALARRSMVPSRNSPSRLPSGRAATVRPVSSSGPHFTRPKAMRTQPQSSVARRDARKSLRDDSADEAVGDDASSAERREKSSTVDAARELSEPLALDIATA